MSRFFKATGFRWIVGLLAVAWVPYVSTLCSSAEGCEVLGAAKHHVHHHAQGAQRDVASAVPHHEHPAAPAASCCEITGKRAVGLSSQPEISTQPSLAALSCWPPATICSVVVDASPRASAHARGLPTYLRNVSFRI